MEPTLNPIFDQIIKAIPMSIPEANPVRENIKKVTAEIRAAARANGNWEAAISLMMLHWARDRERLETELESREKFLDTLVCS